MLKKRLPGLKPGSGADRNKLGLPISELYVVEPGLVSRVIASHVFLEGDIQLIHTGVAGGVGAIHVVFYAIERDRNIGKGRGGSLEFPGQVVPFVGCGSVAGDAGINPVAIGITPNIEMSTRDVALCAKNPSLVAIGLVVVEFQRLRVLRQLDIKIDVITQVGRPVGGAKLLPPEGVGVRRTAGYGENSGYAAQRGRGGSRCVNGCSRARCINASTSHATLPAGHSLNLTLDCLGG